MTDEGTLGHHGRGTMDMTMVPQKLFSKNTENIKTFDLEDCACILFTFIDFAVKGLHVRINAT